MRVIASSSVRPSRRPVHGFRRPGAVRQPETVAPATGIVRISEARPAGLIGLVAQSMHHTVNTGRPEESLVHANDAYLRADGLRFRSQPYLSRVA